jgi:hypothetical protein
MLENLIGKKPEGQRVDATGLQRFAEGGEARVGGSAPAVAGRTGRAARKAADPQTESRAMLERLDAATPVERAVFESTGMEPGLDRAMMLPFAGSREEGNLQLAAPGFVYDAARAFVTPGMAARGQQVSDEDILNTAMNVIGGGVGASRVAGPRAVPDEVLLGMGVGSRGAPTAADDLAELTANGLTTSLANPSATGGTLGDALSQLNITPQRVEKWRSSREGMRQEKVSQVQQAAEELRAGNISTEEYQRTVRQYQPIKPLGAVQKMPTVEEVAMALGKNAETSPGIVGVNVNLPDGTRVASRLDIPAYDKYDTWVVSLHDGNKTGGNAIGYGQAAVLNDVNFMSSAKAALNIATGKSAKGTIARIYGNWENRDPSAIAQQARDILSGKAADASDWIEVGMNPYRHSYFYRKSDGMPVASAEQVIQVGPLVLAKKPVTRPVESPEHQIDTPMGTRYFKKGGNVERVRNDNRRYL